MLRVAAVVVTLWSVAAYADDPFTARASAMAKPGTHVALTAKGAWLETRVKDRTELAVSDQSGDRPRILYRDTNLELIMYVERGGLDTVVLDGAEVYPTEAAAASPLTADSPGVKLTAAMPAPKTTPASHGLLEIDLDDELYPGKKLGHVHGFMRADKLGLFYADTDAPSIPFDAEVVTDFELLDAPKGQSFYREELLKDKGKQHAHPAKIVAKRGAYTLVRIQSRLGELVGWVDARAVKPKPSERGRGAGLLGSSPCVGCNSGSTPANTPLFDAPNGRLVGHTRRAMDMAPYVEQRSGWGRTMFGTPYGMIWVWVKA